MRKLIFVSNMYGGSQILKNYICTGKSGIPINASIFEHVKLVLEGMKINKDITKSDLVRGYKSFFMLNSAEHKRQPYEN